MSNSRSNSIMTNPLSEMLNKNSLVSENDFSTSESPGINWLSIILGIIILGFFVFVFYKYYTKGENVFENIYEKIYFKIKDFIEYIKNWFQSTTTYVKSAQTKIENHMKEDHGVEEKKPEPTPEPEHKSPQKQAQEMDEKNKKELSQALDKATPNYSPSQCEYDADDSYSSIQKSKSSSKSGWCYIGEDRGFRSCINIGENDTCMSGDIFPTSDICVNPNLRM